MFEGPSTNEYDLSDKQICSRSLLREFKNWGKDLSLRLPN